MSFKIIEDCINCGACESVCPNEAIDEGDTIFVIDPEKCSECKGYFDAQQCAEVCPVEACVPDQDHVETEAQLLAKAEKHKKA